MEIQPSPNLSSRNGGRPLQALPANFSTASFESEESTFNLAQPLIILRRRLNVVLGVAIALSVVTIPLAIWGATRKPPQYAGSFQLLVEPVTADAQLKRLTLDSQQRPGEALQTAPTALDYPTQIQILQSPKILAPVLQTLQVKYPTLTYDRLVSNLKIGRILPKNATKDTEGTKILGFTYQDFDPALTEAVVKELATTYLKYSLQERQTNIGQGIKFIDNQLPQLRQRVNTLQRQLQVFRQQNAIINPDLQGTQASGQAGALQQQQFEASANLAEKQTQFSTLAQQSARANTVTVLAGSPQYQALLSKYQEIQSAIALESARSREANPTLQALRAKQRNMEQLLQQESQRVLGKTGDDIQILQARNQAINRAKGEVDQKIQAYPALARQFADLDRELKVATDSLTEFLTKREALQIDAAQKEVPWELVSPPVLASDPLTGEPQNVSQSTLPNYLALAVFLSLMMGIGAGFLADGSSNAYHTSNQLKQAIRLALLGAIPLDAERQHTPQSWLTKLPFMKRKRRVATPHQTGDPAALDGLEEIGGMPVYFPSRPALATSLTASSPFLEAFRSLYKNIRLLPLNAPIRSLTISSAEPGDGKTTIAVNLAQAAAAMGQRVLLVDADLRHPQVHHVMGLANQCGLSDVITSNVNVKNALQPFPIRENLMVLTAGLAAVDPTEALTSGKMRVLMERFQMVFDLVIYDTPPLVGLADGSLVAAQTNGLALVVRLGKTKRPSVAQAIEEVKLSSTTLLGLVANGSTEVIMPYGYYYQPRAQPQKGTAPIELEN
ncbi:GumC family protein [Stenomitos frigidus]|uniref:non-specific protein-tyrosine kinase n=1 Tax=Stenomitos frigidus ULC18 TaxID=2107698 RepID=A0A2T1DYN3_9CYAN|nr:polysaccharide biosynthesis tyrosine autokinase [Stenomitos frigidus]PSB25592.1 hypothetical protein C7B82_22490 [Stenomitos frigidus ULC18]